jgi:bifunctional non-homologous end joining protein LigD
MSLQVYRTKRKFSATPEPRGRQTRRKGHAFVIQKHAATRLHYDLRLEHDGVMKSWAVTRGPSLVPGEKRLAVRVEDHPVEYNSFEGIIPEGEYGGGTVMVWDRGTWQPEGDPARGLAKGRLDFTLDGQKLHGAWHLVRMRRRPGEKRDNWLLIKARDEASRGGRDPDILEEAPDSVVSGRSIDEIAHNKRRRVWQSNRPARKQATTVASAPRAASRVAAAKTARDTSTNRKTSASAKKPARAAARAARSASKRSPPRRAARPTAPAKPWSDTDVRFTHPDRVYWVDAGVTKQDLADYYRDVWDWMAAHVHGRPLALVRCPDGTKGQCFFQKHASAGLAEQNLHTVIDSKGRQIIAVESLAGLLSLVQAGVLEVHVRGARIESLERCDRVVFDLDPGEGVGWPDIVAAAQDVHDRLAALDLETFVKLSGGKGLHVVLPTGGQDWDTTKTFVQAFAQAMAADAPDRYIAKLTKAARKGKIFVDYLRNSLEQTSVAAYSTRARAGAPVSVPVAWQELGRTTGGNQYTVINLMERLRGLKQDPWEELGKVRQKLPDLQTLRRRA